ncbi:hypothetical protein LG3211_0629 [Lysobacter gummosus]|nr:hypothetical protein LG3211_0629 [Lysobacter gummosus]
MALAEATVELLLVVLHPRDSGCSRHDDRAALSAAGRESAKHTPGVRGPAGPRFSVFFLFSSFCLV